MANLARRESGETTIISAGGIDLFKVEPYLEADGHSYYRLTHLVDVPSIRCNLTHADREPLAQIAMSEAALLDPRRLTQAAKS